MAHRIKSRKHRRNQRSSFHSRRRNKAKSARKRFSIPRTTKQLFALPTPVQDEWNRAVQIPAEMRFSGLSLTQASKLLGLTPRRVLRLAGSAFRKTGGRYKVRPTDNLLRVLLIPSAKGLREIALKDSREASVIGQYWSAVEKYLGRGDVSALKKLQRKTVRDASGRRVRLLLDLKELQRQASAGVLHFESLYGRRA